MLSQLNKLNARSTWLYDIAWMTILLGIFYAIWIGSHPLFTPDEGRYSEVAREMVVTGDYITPRLNGVVFLDKPILYYWLQAISIKLFGLKESALRFWPSIIGIICCLFVYLAGRQLFDRKTGILAALILASSPLFYGAAHYANLDLEVASFISMCLLSFIMAVQTKPSRLKTILLMTSYLFAALATLTKGLIGIVLPCAVIGTWILLTNRWHLLKNVRLFSGLLIFLCVTTPWYILAQLANPEFFHFFFVTQQFSRFLTMDTFNNQTAAWFYLPIVALGFFPWTIFFIGSVIHHANNLWKNRQAHTIELFLLLWVVLIFVFFSIPRSKTVGYILPIFPGLALLTARYLSTQWSAVTTTKGIKLSLACYVLITTAIFCLCISAPYVKFLAVDKHIISYLAVTGILFLTSGIALLFIRKKSLSHTVYILLITAAAFALTINASSTALNQKTVKPLALYLRNIIKPQDEVVTYYKYYQDLPIYLERRITIVADWSASDIPLYDNWLRELWYGMSFQDTHHWLLYDNEFWKRWHSKQHLYVLLNQNYFSDFQSKAHGKIYKLNQFNDVILVSNVEMVDTRCSQKARATLSTLPKNPKLSQSKRYDRQNCQRK